MKKMLIFLIVLALIGGGYVFLENRKEDLNGENFIHYKGVKNVVKFLEVDKDKVETIFEYKDSLELFFPIDEQQYDKLQEYGEALVDDGFSSSMTFGGGGAEYKLTKDNITVNLTVGGYEYLHENYVTYSYLKEEQIEAIKDSELLGVVIMLAKNK